jgi:hypothetical protein
LEYSPNRFGNFVPILIRLEVPHPVDPVTVLFEPRGSALIVFHLLGVLTSIEFKYESSLQADEIYDERAKWMLPSEFIPTELLSPYPRPDEFFCLGHVLAKLSRAVSVRMVHDFPWFA